MNLFNQISGKRSRSNSFDLSHEKKMSFNMGELIPSLVQEVVPGDKFQVNTEIMMRLAPMLAPVMHRCNVYTHFFFVPNRLTWDEWEDFITGGREGDLLPVFPKMEINNSSKGYFVKGRLPDYMGVPVYDSGVAFTKALDVGVLPFRAYNLIYDQYYRDQNVSAPLDLPITGGDLTLGQTFDLTTIRKRAWEKDYFTSCLPWAQRGGEVSLPIDANFSPQYSVDTTGTGADGNIKLTSGVVQSSVNIDLPLANLDDPQIVGGNLTINDLRLSVRLQEWLEKNARGGARYIEQILSHFGVKSSDARLQRAEYLGGGKSPVVISEVLQTADTVDNPTGYMAGHGLSVANSNRFTKRFEEHGYVIGIVSVLPRTAYQQGLDRTFSKFDKLDYYWPEFANLGEQEVLNKELLYRSHSLEEPNGTFGYQSRYAEYKFKQSSVHGDFRDELAFWHMGRIFDSVPLLNQSFIEADPTHRIFAVWDPANPDPSVHKLWVQLYNNVKAIRPMPKFGTPTL